MGLLFTHATRVLLVLNLLAPPNGAIQQRLWQPGIGLPVVDINPVCGDGNIKNWVAGSVTAGMSPEQADQTGCAKCGECHQGHPLDEAACANGVHAVSGANGNGSGSSE